MTNIGAHVLHLREVMIYMKCCHGSRISMCGHCEDGCFIFIYFSPSSVTSENQMASAWPLFLSLLSLDRQGLTIESSCSGIH